MTAKRSKVELSQEEVDQFTKLWMKECLPSTKISEDQYPKSNKIGELVNFCMDTLREEATKFLKQDYFLNHTDLKKIPKESAEMELSLMLELISEANLNESPDSSFSSTNLMRDGISCVGLAIISLAYCRAVGLRCLLGHSYGHVFCLIEPKKDSVFIFDIGSEIAERFEIEYCEVDYHECMKPKKAINFSSFIPVTEPEQIVAELFRNLINKKENVDPVLKKVFKVINRGVKEVNLEIQAEYQKQYVLGSLQDTKETISTISGGYSWWEEDRKKMKKIKKYLRGDIPGVKGIESMEMKLFFERIVDQCKIAQLTFSADVQEAIIDGLLDIK